VLPRLEFSSVASHSPVTFGLGVEPALFLRSFSLFFPLLLLSYSYLQSSSRVGRAAYPFGSHPRPAKVIPSWTLVGLVSSGVLLPLTPAL
jgi:hypothetical protein